MRWDWPHLKYIRSKLAKVTTGECKRMMLLMPTQHGKSTQVTERYPLYRMQREPGLRVAIASYAETIASRFSRKAKQIADDSGIPRHGLDRETEWELANGSSLYAVGVGGSLTSRPVDLGIIDDPVKDREEADSQPIRDKCWDWYLDVFRKRLQERAAQVVIMTPWHSDDLHGRILNSSEAKLWEVVRLPALAEDDPERPDPLGRLVGEPLCAERYTREYLEHEREIDPEGFESLQQLRPTARGGVFFKRDWFEIVDEIPADAKVERLRYFDLAATIKKTSAYTSGVLIAKTDRYWYIEDVIRGRWMPAERNDVIFNSAQRDNQLPGFKKTWFEEQPGGAGVETSDAMVRRLAGMPVESDRVTGSKETRAEPLADVARRGLVKIVRAPWNAAFIAELASFPRGAFKDQVDSASGAFNKSTISEPELMFGRSQLSPPKPVKRFGGNLLKRRRQEDWND